LRGPDGESVARPPTSGVARSRPIPSQLTRWRRRYLLATIGAAVIGFWAVMVVIGPAIAPYPHDTGDLLVRLKGPSAQHLFGTDTLGRDVFSRVLEASRTSLPAGILVVAISGLFGIVYGGIAAYVGGLVEEAMMRIADIVLAFPALLLALAIAAALGSGIANAIAAIAAVWWPAYARLFRSLVLVQREQEYVQAARVLGYGPARILLRHIFPNAFGPLVVLMTLDVGNAIITFAALSFLGLGVVPPTPEWGAMVSDGRSLITQWWVSAFPGLVIFSVVLGFNFLGDALRDYLDPRARRR
jgi:peptide/nickel transport system permease protein